MGRRDRSGQWLRAGIENRFEPDPARGTCGVVAEHLELDEQFGGRDPGLYRFDPDDAKILEAATDFAVRQKLRILVRAPLLDHGGIEQWRTQIG